MYKKKHNMSDNMSPEVKDYQPGMDQFAGSMMDKANLYMERHDKGQVKEAKDIKKQEYKGRYD